MNQCDINYRQSSNKRLLVELTLIEVAQITQPEEGPANGRKPRRLKTLFKKLMQQTQPKKVAPQVAAAPSAPSAAPSSTVTAEKKKEEEETPKPQRPVLKVASLGMSWNNLRNEPGTSTAKMNIPPGILGGDRGKEDNCQFSQEDLELQWMSMCNRMPKHLVGIATRMKNMTPVITEMPKVKVVVGNDLIRQELEKIRGNIQNTLKAYLHNTSIVLDIEVDEHHDEVKVLTRREQFNELVKSNSSIEKLRMAFDLELA